MANTMYQAAKAGHLDQPTVDLWEARVRHATRRLEASKPPDVRLRSLLDKKKQREDRVGRLRASTSAKRKELDKELTELDEALGELEDIEEEIAHLKETDKQADK